MVKSRKSIALLVVLSILLSLFSNIPLPKKAVASNMMTLPNGSIAILPAGVTSETKVKGYGINVDVMMKDRILVFGTNDKSFLESINPRAVDRPSAKNNYEYRYIGYDLSGALHTNPNFPPDVDSGKMPWERDIIYRPWEKGLLGPDITTNTLRDLYPKESEELIKKILQKYNFPSNGMSEKELIKYYLERYYIQALPSPGLTGSVRQFHRLANGEIWYQTLTYEQPIQIIEKHSVKADFQLKDKVYEYQEVGYKDTSTAENSHITYRRLTIDGKSHGYFAKIENNTNPDIRLRKGIYTFTLYVENFFGDTDTISKTIEVIEVPKGDEDDPASNDSEPIAIVVAPEKAAINENFTVSAKPSMASIGAKIIEYQWYIGDNTSSLQHHPEYDNLNEISVSYPKPRKKYFQVRIKDTRNRSAISNIASTEIIDNTPTSVIAKVDVPDTVYEGVFFDVYTYGSKVIYGDNNMSVETAVNNKIATYYYDLSCNYEGKLGPNGGEIYVEELGQQTIEYGVETRNASDKDVDTFNVLPTPQTRFYVSGIRKENRRLVIDTTGTLHHVKYPIDHDKTVIKIKDMQTGEIATIKKSSNTDRTYIKTTRLKDDGIAEWTAKKAGEYEIEVTTFDTRGKSNTLVKTIRVEKDIPPEANIVSLDVVYRDSTGKATIKVTKNPLSRDSDIIDVQKLEYRYDKNNNGRLDDESFEVLTANTETVDVVLNKVGKVEFKYYVKETFDHIPAHVTDSDFLSNTQTKVITVDNIAPITSFDVIKKSKVDILAFSDKTNFSTAKNKTEQLKETLNNDSTILVDVRADTKEADTGNNVIEHVVNKDTYETAFNSLLASNEKTFVFRGSNNKLYWISWDNLAQIKSIAYSTYDEYKVIDYVENNIKKQRLFARKDRILYELDITTGNVLYAVEIETSGRNNTFSLNNISLDTKRNVVIVSRYYYNYTYNVRDYCFYEIDGSTGNVLNKQQVQAVNSYGIEFLGKLDDTVLLLFPGSLNFKIYKIENNTLTLLNTVDNTITHPSSNASSDRPRYKYTVFNNQIYLFYEYYYRVGKNGDRYGWRDFIYVIDKNGQVVKSRLIDRVDDSSSYTSIIREMRILDINANGIYIAYDDPEFVTNEDVLKYNINTLALDYRIKTPTHSYTYGQIINVGGYNPNGYVVYVGTGSSTSKRGYVDYLRYSLKDGSLVTDRFGIIESATDGKGLLVNMHNDIQNRFHVGYNEDRFDTKLVFLDAVNDTAYMDTSVKLGFDFGIQIDDHRIYLKNLAGREIIFDYDTNTIQQITATDGAASHYIVSPNRNHFTLMIVNSSNNSIRFRLYKINKGFMSIMDDLESYTKRSESTLYIPIITKDNIVITERETTKLINKVKQLNGKIIFLGSNNNSTIGQRLANSTGGMFATYSTLDDAYNKIRDFIKNDIGGVEKNKTIYVKKGEEIYYSKYYADPEGDPVYEQSGEKWKYSQDLSYPHPDGIIADNNKWLTAPKQFIDKVGRFLVSFLKQDNPPPGNAAYESYRKWSSENPIEIIVYDGERPAEVNVPPKINITAAGNLRENHRVDFIITVLPGSKDINWATLDITFDTTDYLPYTKPNTLKFSRVFRNTGKHTITAKISDVDGKQAINTLTFEISPDLPPVAGFTIEGDGKRNENGIANFVFSNIAKATDDQIGEINYFIEGISYVDNGDGTMSPNGYVYYPLSVSEDGKVDIERLGESNIKQVVTDFYVNGIGLNGEDLDQYRIFKTAEALNVLVVNNEAPIIEYTVAPNVVIVGDKVSHNVIITDDTPSGDSARYMFVHDEIYFDNSQGKHERHNMITDDPTEILNKKGIYMFFAQAVDEDGTYSDWVLGGQVKVVTRPVSDFTLVAYPNNNDGENRQFENNFFKKGSVITVQNMSYSEDYTSAFNKGIAYYKLEFRDVTDQDWTLVTEKSGLTTYIYETDLPRINDRGIYEVRQTVKTPDGIEAVATKRFTMLELRMEAELEPDRIYPSQSYKIKAKLSQDGQGAVAYIDYLDQWVTLNKVAEDAANKYYETSITTEETMPDGDYLIEVYGLYPFNNEIIRDLTLIVDTPIEMSSDVIPLGPNQFNTNYILQNNSPDNDYIKSAFSESINVSVNVISPITISQVTAILSNSEKINLVYNNTTGAWEGVYNIYKDTAGNYIKDKDYYKFNIEATAVNGSKANNNHKVWVYTPVNLISLLENYLSVGAEYNIAAITSKYADTVTVTMFEGTSYETTFSLTKSAGTNNHLNWGKYYTIPTIPEGTYKVRYTGSTCNGTTETQVLDINILELTVEGAVNHTNKWNENRIKYNLSKTNNPDSPRPYNVFFPGEKFILKAETNPGAQADRVEVEILGTPYSTTLTNTMGDIWEGELWHEDMLYWNDRTLTFRFTAYKAGLQKTDDVVVYIIKDEYWLQHRLF